MTSLFQQMLEEESSVSEQNIEKAEAEGKIRPLTFSEKIMLIAQGFTLNTSDEVVAAVKSLFGDKTYEQALREEQDKLKKAKLESPTQSAIYEIGGAIVPGVALGLATGGASAPLTIGRAIKIGASTGAVSGYMGTDLDATAKEKAISTATGTALGTAGGASGTVISKLGGLIKNAKDYLSRVFGNKLSKPVEGEILRIVETTGMPAENVVQKISQGEIIPDLSENAAQEVRGLYAKTGANVIPETLKRRSEKGFDVAKSTLMTDLTGSSNIANATKYFNLEESALKKAESNAYNSIFANNPSVNSNVVSEVANVLKLDPALRREIQKEINLSGAKPLFKITKKGQFEMLRDPDLETAEIIRRVLFSKSTQMTEKGSTRQIYRGLESNLRKAIDDFSPDLKQTRYNWAQIEASKSAFDEGKKVFGKNIDDLEVYFENLTKQGNQDFIDAFRLGVASSIRNKLSMGTGKSLINNINDLTRKERMILERIYPEDSLPIALEKIRVASQSIKSYGRVAGGSPTALTEGAKGRVGEESFNLIFDVSDLLKGSVGAGIRLLKRMLPETTKKLSKEQLEQVANVIVSENSDLLGRIVNDQSLLTELSNQIYKTINTLGYGAVTGVPETLKQTENIPFVSESFAEDEDVSSIVNGMSKETKQKIIQQYYP